MTLQTVVFAICDICGVRWETTEAYRPFTLVVDGQQLAGDFCEKDRIALREQLAPYLGVMRSEGRKKPVEVQHLATPVDDRVRCSECGATFTQRRTLDQHLTKVHGHQHPHQCDLCEQAFSTARGLARHRSDMHANATSSVA